MTTRPSRDNGRPTVRPDTCRHDVNPRRVHCRPSPARRNQRGEINLLALMIATVVVLLFGLSVDGASRISAGQEATAIARQAARAGGQQINAGVAASGQGVTTNQAVARAAAQRYLRAAGATGDVTVTGDRVAVTATIQWRPIFLTMLTSPVSGRSSATVTTTDGGG